MALMSLIFPPLVAETVLDFLVGPADYYKTKFQSTLNELLDNKIGREAKADQLQQYLDTCPTDALRSIVRSDHIEYTDHGHRRTQSHKSYTNYVLTWNNTKYYGPCNIEVRKRTFSSPWTYTITHHEVLSSTPIESRIFKRVIVTRSEAFTFMSQLTMSQLLLEMDKSNYKYQNRDQL